MSEKANDTAKVTTEAVSRRGFLLGTTAATLAASIPGVSMAAASTLVSVASAPYQPLPSGKKLRLGIVGGNFGLGFPWHLHPNCEVTAVADLFDDRRDRMKKQFGCDNAYAEFHPMLKDRKVDAVAFYTYGPDHARHCIDAMKAGKHAMTVIPAAVRLEDCQELIDTVKATGLTYMYAETGCFHPAAMASRAFYKEGKYGDVYYTAGEYVHSVYTGTIEQIMKAGGSLIKDGERTWRWGFPQGWYSGHAVGPIIHATRDRYVEVSAVGMDYQYEPFKENPYGNRFVNTTLFYRTALGKPSTIKIHWMSASPGREGADIHGTRMSLFEAREGLPAAVSYPEQRPAALDLSAFTQSLPPQLREVQGHGGAHPQIIHEFVSACLRERTPAVDVYQAVAVAAAGIVGFQSALKGGESLKIPDFGSIA